MSNPKQQAEKPIVTIHPDNPSTLPCQTALDCYAKDRDEQNPKDSKNKQEEHTMGQTIKHTPFDNPETEAYWNRPCRHGKYPYPDENVFLVMGGKVKGQEVTAVAEPSIIVSLTPQLAQEYYVDVSNDPQIKAISCISLAQAKLLSERFEQLSHVPDGILKIKPGLMNALFYDPQLFWLIGTDAQGVSIEKPVQTSTVKDVLAWAEQEHIQVLGCLPASAITGALEEMEKVQQGALDGDETYAYDFANAEDLKESDVMTAMESVEEKDEWDESCLKYLKKTGNYSDLDYKTIEASFIADKEKRHSAISL